MVWITRKNMDAGLNKKTFFIRCSLFDVHYSREYLAKPSLRENLEQGIMNVEVSSCTAPNETGFLW
jgi:hypothetical protein